MPAATAPLVLPRKERMENNTFKCRKKISSNTQKKKLFKKQKTKMTNINTWKIMLWNAWIYNVTEIAKYNIWDENKNISCDCIEIEIIQFYSTFTILSLISFVFYMCILCIYRSHSFLQFCSYKLPLSIFRLEWDILSILLLL